MDEELVLRVKEKESLEIIKYIAIGYLIFLFFYALVLGYKETIIQASFILVFAVVIDAINCGEMIANEKGIKTKATGLLKYNQIHKINLNNRILSIYTQNTKKPFKIYFSMNEDYKLIEKTYKFIDSKVKRIEEDSKEHEEYINKYL